jgi:NAD(P)-dependent dehydrogenase (short-subunit alcohol dehydrogenase family)
MGRVQGKVAFITGAARGQGRSHALRLAEEGADIIAVDICHSLGTVNYQLATSDDLKETAAAIEKLDRRVVAVEADVRDRSCPALRDEFPKSAQPIAVCHPSRKRSSAWPHWS